MAFCKKCGTEIVDGVCPNCGASNAGAFRRLLSRIIVAVGFVVCALWSSLLRSILVWFAGQMSGVSSTLFRIIIWVAVGGVVTFLLFTISKAIAAATMTLSDKMYRSAKGWRYKITAWFLLLCVVGGVILSIINSDILNQLVYYIQLGAFSTTLLIMSLEYNENQLDYSAGRTFGATFGIAFGLFIIYALLSVVLAMSGALSTP